MKTKTIFYWVTTSLLAFELLYGAGWDLTRQHHVVAVIAHLGYPLYLLTILGFWKVLAAIALLVPGFPRLKEWTYAGVFFEMTGAAASWVATGGNMGEFIVSLIVVALVMASWALRPQTRTLGVLFRSEKHA